MLIIILSVIAIGLILLVLEILFIPGTTLVGLLGVGFTLAGVILTYQSYGVQAGTYSLVATSVISLGTLVYALRTGFWSKFSLKSAITSKFNEGITDSVQLNERGTTVSTLRPIGKARFNDRELEVKTLGGYISEGVDVRVIQIESTQIIVEPTN